MNVIPQDTCIQNVAIIAPYSTIFRSTAVHLRSNRNMLHPKHGAPYLRMPMGSVRSCMIAPGLNTS
jgi:hypothetical protein